MAAITMASSAALALASCSFLFGDPYGDFMQNADSWVNLRSEVKGQRGLELRRVVGLSAARSWVDPAYREYVFFQAEYSDGFARQGALDYGGLGLVPFDRMADAPGTFNVGVDYQGFFCVGRNFYDPVDLEAGPGNCPSGNTPWLLSWDNGSSRYNHYFSANSSDRLLVDSYDQSWNFIGTREWIEIGAAGERWNLARLQRMRDDSVCLLFSQEGGRMGTIQAVFFRNAGVLFSMLDAGLTDFLGRAATAGDSDMWASARTSFVNYNGSYGSPSGANAWITEQGIVSLSDDADDRFTFSRFPKGPGPASDSYRTSAKRGMLFYFEPSGRYWYAFDQGTGRLYRLRTWWS